MALDTSASSTRLAAPSAPSAQPAVQAIPWVSIIWFTLLLIGLFAETLHDMVGEWFTNE